MHKHKVVFDRPTCNFHHGKMIVHFHLFQWKWILILNRIWFETNQVYISRTLSRVMPTTFCRSQGILIQVLMWQLAIYECGLIRKLSGRLYRITKVMIILVLVARRVITSRLSLMWTRKLSFTRMSTETLLSQSQVWYEKDEKTCKRGSCAKFPKNICIFYHKLHF